MKQLKTNSKLNKSINGKVEFGKPNFDNDKTKKVLCR